MNELRFEAVTTAELVNLNASFTPGIHVVLGAEHDGTDALLRAAAGSTRPKQGRAFLNGVAPYSDSRTRRGIATLFADESSLSAHTVQRSVALALRARADSRSALAVLDAAGLAAFATYRVSELSAREARAVALAIALCHPAPSLLALHEPYALAGSINPGFIAQKLRDFAAARAVVVCTVSRLSEAERIGGALFALERGVWLDPAALRGSGTPVTLRVQTPEPRRLVARLSEAPDVTAVEWAGAQELLVRGHSLEVLAHSVVANARAEAIRITALKSDPPPLALLAAAHASRTASTNTTSERAS